MDNQQIGTKMKIEKMNEAAVRIPNVVEVLGRGGNSQISNPETSPENMNNETLITKVNIRPNPFYTSITLEVISGQNKQVVVRMANEDGKIMKLFGWYLLKGTNVTTITELSSLNNGEYTIDITSNDGVTLFNIQLKKA